MWIVKDLLIHRAHLMINRAVGKAGLPIKKPGHIWPGFFMGDFKTNMS